MSRKFKVLLVIISLSLTLSLMSNTYSRYVADTTSDIELQFANWQILVNENDITNNSVSSINIVPILEENNNIATNSIAPTSKGYFDIEIDPSNVEVSFDYQINFELLNDNMPDLLISKYAILDSNYVEGDSLTTIPITDNQINNLLTYDNSTENFRFEPFKVRIYFEWYEGQDENMNDEADTQIGNEAATNDAKLQIKTTIAFSQINNHV